MCRWLCSALVVFVLLCLSSCTTPVHRYRIAVSQCSEDIWRDKLNRELKTGEYLNDSIHLLFASANDDDQLQKAQIRAFVKQGVDLLIVAPNQLKTISPAIDEAVAKGIPVILFDRKTSTDRYTAFMGCDNYRIGAEMAHFIAQSRHGNGRVVEIKGLAESSPAIERHRGFSDVLKGYPGIQLVASEAADWKESGGKAAMLRVLKHHNNIDYVFAQNDRMALGARRAVQQSLPAEAARRVRYVGVDALPTPDGGLNLVRQGILEASYLYPTQGDEVLALAMRVLRKQAFARENYLHSTIVTKDNAEQMFMQAKDMQRQNEYLDTLHRRVDAYLAQYNMQKLFLTGVLIFLVLIIIASALVFRQYQLKTRLNEELQRRNDELNRLTNEINALTQSQTAFFTNISHELRTPLTLILDPLERLLHEEELTPGHQSLLGIVHRNALTLKELVNMLLDFRKVEVGKMDLRLQRLNLPQLLNDRLQSFMLMAQAHKIDLSLITRNLQQEVVTVDGQKLHRMVDNLLSNAVKHTPQGGSIVVEASTVDDNRFAIRVTDSGTGIAPDLLPHVFERFVQARDANGGTGIGLALVRAFARLQGGDVTVESKLGQGSTFTILLPNKVEGEMESDSVEMENNAHFIDANAALNTAESAPEEAANASFTTAQSVSEEGVNANDKPCVLLVDDHLDLLHYEQHLLDAQYRVITAVNGQEAWEKAVQMVPDIVVSDVMMPVMDGLELCRRLKQNMATSHIPVILLTAKHLDEQRIEGYEQGADSYITKPFNHALLLARMRNLLEERQQLQRYFNAHAEASIEDVGTTKGSSMDKPDEMGKKLSMRDREFLARLHATIEEQMGNSAFNIELLGVDMGFSRVQLYRKTKALTGLSPVELLRRTRLRAAHHRLCNSSKSISEVAYEVGFSSPAYFTKCFRDAFGVTPGEIQH